MAGAPPCEQAGAFALQDFAATDDRRRGRCGTVTAAHGVVASPEYVKWNLVFLQPSWLIVG